MRTASTTATKTFFATIMVLVTRGSAANPYPVSAEHVGGPVRSIASDDVAGTRRQPREPRWLPGPELRWTSFTVRTTLSRWVAARPGRWRRRCRSISGRPCALISFSPRGGDPPTLALDTPTAVRFSWLTFGLSAPLGERCCVRAVTGTRVLVRPRAGRAVRSDRRSFVATGFPSSPGGGGSAIHSAEHHLDSAAPRRQRSRVGRSLRGRGGRETDGAARSRYRSQG